MNSPLQDRLRHLPSVDSVLACTEDLGPWSASPLAVDAVRTAVSTARDQLRSDDTAAVPTPQQLADSARTALDERFRSPLRRVFNGTGVVIHTNLGRAALSESAIEAMNTVARGYSTLEYDIARGRRGSRHNLVHEPLVALTDAEDALVANNNASALLLALTALAKRKEVIVSRGQLVEIGGSFRIPDICRLSGARLVEVGTTNRTRIADMEAAITDRTGVLLRVHPSNFRVIGFTQEVPLDEMVALGRKHGIPVVDDLGSGALEDITAAAPLPREPLVRESVATGADVVTFSGDKLLGGPQAGIAVGRAEFIHKMRKHPLMRVVRPDKLSFAALDATLRSYLQGQHIPDLPVWRMLHASLDDLRAWLEPLREELTDIVATTSLTLSLRESQAYAGGGSLPEEILPSLALAVEGPQRALTALQRRLRLGEPPVIGYITDGRFLLDARTLIIADRNEVARALRTALEG